MALKKDILKQNAVLASLTDEQITAIETLSTNDEETVIGARIGQIYRDLDKTIKDTTGIDRNGDEKTYNYLERASKALKDKVAGFDELNNKVSSLEKEKTRLEKVISEGGSDGETAKQLKQVRAELETTKTQYNELKGTYDTDKTNHAKELFNLKLTNDLNSSLGAIKLKKDLPKTVTDVLVNQAIEKVKGYNPDYIDDGNGGKRLVFKNADGGTMNNPENKLNPYTANELLIKELKSLEIYDDGNGKGGAGGSGSGGSGGSGKSTFVDLSGAKSQKEAYDFISTQLLADGLTYASKEFDTRMSEIMIENKVTDLPIE